ncbi:hypothetical protein [Brevundimonas phoenicis]|uniref:hypothetical protein n=1 Tax=unclassified Brevundimonas TaxID=2622653 RepID=UPI0039A2774F
MAKTFHDLVEACYRGQHLVLEPDKSFEAGSPLRENRENFEVLISHPSYHFGTMLAGYSDHIAAEAWGEPPVQTTIDLMKSLHLERVALVFDSEVHAGETSVVLLESAISERLGVSVATFGMDDRHGAHFKGKWMVFEDIGPIGNFSWPMIWLATVALELLAKPEVQYVVRAASNGMAALRTARAKRGEGTIPDMQVIHLKKKVYIGGVAVGGGTHASPEPHDRAGHWRHSEREIPGWEEVEPTTGEYAGMTVWRKWIKDTPIKGGKPNGAAPQFRVVK